MILTFDRRHTGTEESSRILRRIAKSHSIGNFRQVILYTRAFIPSIGGIDLRATNQERFRTDRSNWNRYIRALSFRICQRYVIPVIVITFNYRFRSPSYRSVIVFCGANSILLRKYFVSTAANGGPSYLSRAPWTNDWTRGNESTRARKTHTDTQRMYTVHTYTSRASVALRIVLFSISS